MTIIDYSKSHKWMSDYAYIKEFTSLITLDKSYHVSDAGCGSGYVAAKIRPKVKELLQIDHDWAMLSKNNLAKHTDTLKASLLNLWMIGDEIFDAIFCRSVMHRLKQPDHAYREFIRILKPNGKLAVSVSPLPDDFQDEYKKIMDNKGFRLYLTAKEWKDLFLRSEKAKVLKEGRIKFNLDLRHWGLLKEHENASGGFRKYFKLSDGIIECQHAYFVIEKI
ncbi:MAG: class I SAM-dependent methyltransferase [Nanoarchaeota archaeon]